MVLLHIAHFFVDRNTFLPRRKKPLNFFYNIANCKLDFVCLFQAFLIKHLLHKSAKVIDIDLTNLKHSL